MELKKLAKVNVTAPSNQTPKPQSTAQSPDDLLRGKVAPPVTRKLSRISEILSKFGKKADQNCKEDIPLIKSGHKRDCDYSSNPYRYNFVDSCDDKNFRRKMNVNIEVDFEDITELIRGLAVQNRNEMHRGPYDNHAAVQPSCTTSNKTKLKSQKYNCLDRNRGCYCSYFRRKRHS